MLSSSFAHPKLAMATKGSANARRHILGEVVHLRREEILGVIEVMEVLLDNGWTGIWRWGGALIFTGEVRYGLNA